MVGTLLFDLITGTLYSYNLVVLDVIELNSRIFKEGSMKTNDVIKLKSGNYVTHKRYGRSKVIEVMLSMGNFFGIVIEPLPNSQGLLQLHIDSGHEINHFLEDSVRNIL